MKIGLLPLFLELYDDTCAQMRPRIEQFRDTILAELAKRGLDVQPAPICRLKEECNAAVKGLENAGVAAIVTLHLAYSPSLECIDALAGTRLPLVVLDTTENYAFDASVSADEILYNHGIHGVQDMCNLLARRGKPYTVFAGHWQNSDVLNRVAAACRGAMAAAAFCRARVGMVGSPFAGMGDFHVPAAELKRRFGIEVVPYDKTAAKARIAAVTAGEIAAERKADEALFTWDASVTDALYAGTARVCLSLRKWLEAEALTALTVNFLATEQNPALPLMPFTECSKAMARGTGYAGEGDALTAAFCGAALTLTPKATFTEMFCPDWQGGSVFLSHMGELNYNVCDEKPRLTEKDFPFTSAENPTVAYGTYGAGKVTLANLAPAADGRYTLILAPGDVLPVPGENNMAESVNGWFKPARPLPAFLEEFSNAGGTHHSVLLYGDHTDELRFFAKSLGFGCVGV